jgi:hypothetical protein
MALAGEIVEVAVLGDPWPKTLRAPSRSYIRCFPMFWGASRGALAALPAKGLVRYMRPPTRRPHVSKENPFVGSASRASPSGVRLDSP